MDGLWAGVILVILTFVAFTAVWRVEDGLLLGWPVPKTNSGDLVQITTAVLSVTALVVLCQVAAILGFIFGRWIVRRLVHA